MTNTKFDKDWKHQFRDLIKTPSGVSEFLGIELTDAEIKTTEIYPVLASRYYLNLIDRTIGRDDPIWKQAIASPDELSSSSTHEDPLSEEAQMPVRRLIHRYTDRAVLLSTNKCTMQCRFCFRKRYLKDNPNRQDITEQELNTVCKYLTDTPSLKEILLSGGDPLIFSNDKIKKILDKLYSVKNIEVVRIASRVPVTLPARITAELVNILKVYDGLWFVTHFNHPKELTKESIEACKKIIQAGIPILNQTVLLKGVNDNSEILSDLFSKLVKIKIKPHYLFHVDPVKGVTHFSTGIDKGLEIIESFRSSLSSLAVPHFAIDLPEGGGKIALQPNYQSNGKYRDIYNSKLIGYPQF